MSQIYNGNTKRPKPKENQLGILGISSREFTHFAENSAEDLGSRREYCWAYISNFAYTGQLIITTQIQAVKLPTTSVTRLSSPFNEKKLELCNVEFWQLKTLL